MDEVETGLGNIGAAGRSILEVFGALGSDSFKCRYDVLDHDYLGIMRTREWSAVTAHQVVH